MTLKAAEHMALKSSFYHERRQDSLALKLGTALCPCESVLSGLVCPAVFAASANLVLYGVVPGALVPVQLLGIVPYPVRPARDRTCGRRVRADSHHSRLACMHVHAEV